MDAIKTIPNGSRAFVHFLSKYGIESSEILKRVSPNLCVEIDGHGDGSLKALTERKFMLPETLGKRVEITSKAHAVTSFPPTSLMSFLFGNPHRPFCGKSFSCVTVVKGMACFAETAKDLADNATELLSNTYREEY